MPTEVIEALCIIAFAVVGSLPLSVSYLLKEALKNKATAIFSDQQAVLSALSWIAFNFVASVMVTFVFCSWKVQTNRPFAAFAIAVGFPLLKYGGEKLKDQVVKVAWKPDIERILFLAIDGALVLHNRVLLSFDQAVKRVNRERAETLARAATSLLSLFGPDIAKDLVEALENNSGSLPMVITMKLPRDIRDRLSKVTDIGGKLQRIIDCYSYDILDLFFALNPEIRKDWKNRTEIHDAKKQLEAMVDSVPYAMMVLNKNRIVKRINEKARAYIFSGKEFTEIVGRPCCELLGPVPCKCPLDGEKANSKFCCSKSRVGEWRVFKGRFARETVLLLEGGAIS